MARVPLERDLLRCWLLAVIILEQTIFIPVVSSNEESNTVAELESLLVEAEAEDVNALVEDGSAVIPCRPASADVRVTLLFYDNDTDVMSAETRDRWAYDPNIGFTISNLSLKDDNTQFICQADHPRKKSKETDFTLYVEALIYSIPAPEVGLVLSQGSGRHVAVGSDFTLRCAGATQGAFQVAWTVPDGTFFNSSRKIDERRTYFFNTTSLRRNLLAYRNYTSTLRVLNASDSDSGTYTCQVTVRNFTAHHHNSTSLSVVVLDAHTDSFINITENERNDEVDAFIGNTTAPAWTVEFDSFPERINVTLYHEGREMQRTADYEISTNSTSTSLSMRNINYDKAGEYWLVLNNNGGAEKRVSKTLKVTGPPTEPVISAQPAEAEFYSTVPEYTLTCAVQANPAAKVEWRFRVCRTYTDVSNCEKESTMLLSNEPVWTAHKGNSSCRIPTNESGYVTCAMENDYGQKHTNFPFFINDVKNGLQISKTSNNVLVGTKMELTCVASKYKFTDKFRWLKDGLVVTNGSNEGFEFSASSTKFSHQSVLRVEYATPEHTGTYTCLAETLQGTNRTMSLPMTIFGQLTPIAIILVTVALSVILLVVSIVLAMKTRKERHLRRELAKLGLQNFESGATECINPELGVDEQAELLPYNMKFEFPREKLRLGKQLGSGAFGVVMKGEAAGILPYEPVSTVAVKMVKRSTDPVHLRALASELKIMVHLGQHLNVVNLLGACTKNLVNRELLVIVEFCCFGNIHSYLLHNRHQFIDQVVGDRVDPSKGRELMVMALQGDRKAQEDLERQYRLDSAALLSFEDTAHTGGMSSSSLSPDGVCSTTQNTATTDTGGSESTSGQQPLWRSSYMGDESQRPTRPICTQDLLCWGFQVARGMEYLASRKVLHGDLAARNILLAKDNIIKICDFGLARSMYKSDNYKKSGEGPLPVKWMSIEAIQDRVFSTQSDVWSFGIVLWELFSLARTPYPGVEADERFFNSLVQGYRMEKPRFATSDIFWVMSDCWRAEPERRPSFQALGERLGAMLDQCVRTRLQELSSPYLQMNQHSSSRDYLAMMSSPSYRQETAIESSPQPEGHSYLAMTSPRSPSSQKNAYLQMQAGSPSVIFSPRLSGELIFQFPSVQGKSEAGVEQTPAELHPLLDSTYMNVSAVPGSPKQTSGAQQALLQQEGSNPYQNVSKPCAVSTEQASLLDLENNPYVNLQTVASSTVAKSDMQGGSAPSNSLNKPSSKSDMQGDSSIPSNNNLSCKVTTVPESLHLSAQESQQQGVSGVMNPCYQLLTI